LTLIFLKKNEELFLKLPPSVQQTTSIAQKMNFVQLPLFDHKDFQDVFFPLQLLCPLGSATLCSIFIFFSNFAFFWDNLSASLSECFNCCSAPRSGPSQEQLLVEIRDLLQK